MDNSENNISSIDDKLFKVKYKNDISSHLKADNLICAKCQEKPCTYICPANVYSWDENENKLIIAYENCLECGACKIACKQNNIDWQYPKPTFGVTFKQG